MVYGFRNQNFKELNFSLEQRRAKYFDIEKVLSDNEFCIDRSIIDSLNKIDIVYRTLCSILYNFVPTSGHPGGSISSGRIVQSLIFKTMKYDFSNPDFEKNDYLSYAAGHKAMGLYAAWALRNEVVRIYDEKLLPQEKYQLRIEDLLGFRRNPVTDTPLFKKFHAKPLDGHPTPLTPFIKLATGASGVGVSSTIGLAFAYLDMYGKDSPKIHMLEGEGGLTPGRVSEAMASAGTIGLNNIILHVDWNQASIDSNRVCREGKESGDYVQWNPVELAFLHDWNVVFVKNGFNYPEILAAQYLASYEIKNFQPTAVIYKTIKGWKYGIEGRSSHGAGHKFASPEFYHSLSEFENEFGISFPRFHGEKNEKSIEENFFECLMVIRKSLEKENSICKILGEELLKSKNDLESRIYRKDAPQINKIYLEKEWPNEVKPEIGSSVTLRGALALSLNYLNKKSNGAIIGTAADLFGSTSLSEISKGISEGYFHFEKNPNARLIMVGGICEDAMGGFMAGVSTFGHHIGVSSSYAAFIASLEHVSARLHAIGQEAKYREFGNARNPFIIICGHSGPKTGEDGPTHADPQALQLVSENFPKGSVITLTPWDSLEIWPLLISALKARPAVIAAFVTRPSETVIDRAYYNLASCEEASSGLYALRKADNKKKRHGTIVLQGNGVTREFVTGVLEELDKRKFNLNVFHVSSAELFDLLPQEEKNRIYPEEFATEAMGITEFTLPTMYRWVTSYKGRAFTLHPFKDDHFLGSGQAEKVFKEAQLDATSQLKAILDYLEEKN